MRLLLITGPSGSGKSTLQNQLITEYTSDYSKMILTTCRCPRRSKNGDLIEKDGQDYHFLDSTNFGKKDLLLRFGNYGISKEDWDLGEGNQTINTLACGFFVANFFSI